MIHVLIYIFSSVDVGECFFFVIDIDEAATPAVCWIKHLIRWCSFFRLGVAASTSPYTVSGCYSSSSNVFYWLNPWVEMSHNIRICLFPIKGIVFRVSALLCSEHKVFFSLIHWVLNICLMCITTCTSPVLAWNWRSTKPSWWFSIFWEFFLFNDDSKVTSLLLFARHMEIVQLNYKHLLLRHKFIHLFLKCRIISMMISMISSR